jgi:hypothetical protein
MITDPGDVSSPRFNVSMVLDKVLEIQASWSFQEYGLSVTLDVL